MFELITPLSYWFLSALWLSILILYVLKFRAIKIVGGAVAVLLTILAIDAFRTTFESLYFGFYFNSQFGLMPSWIHQTLSQPHLLIIPKLINIIAGVLVLILLIRRWIPREIREREEAEEKLKLGQKQLLDIAANVPGVVYQFVQHADGNRNVPYISPKIYDLFGIQADTVMQDANAWFSIVHPDDLEGLELSIQESAENLSTWDWTGRMQHQQDKQWRWVRGTSNPSRMGDNSILWNGVAVDVTKRKNNEDQLRIKLEKLVKERTDEIQIKAQIIDQIKNPVVSATLDGNIVSWNKAAEDVFGYQAEEALGKHVLFLHPEETHDMISSQVIGPLKKQGWFETELEYIKKNRGKFFGHLSVSILKDTDGKPSAMNGVIIDITERKEYEQELISAKNEAEHANRAKSEFLSRMSHELRTPMNAILGFSQLLEMQLTEQQFKNNAHEIVHAGTHLLELINEVLDLSHIESGKLKLSLKPIRLDYVIAECLAIISPLAEQRHIKIVENIITEAGNIIVYSDATRLKQVILNLLSNAVKYNHDSGVIKLEINHMPNSTVRLAIEDTGPGLTAEQQTHLFQPFDRLGAENSSIEGTGIGLIISRRLIEIMGGNIGVESTPGKGSIFWIDIALNTVAQVADVSGTENIEDNSRPAHAHTESQQSLLYIEDNPANLRLVEQIISIHSNYKLLCASRPQLGIELAAVHQPKLILLDINLPDMDGYEVLKRLHVNPLTCDIPVIAVTAHAMPGDTMKIQRAGFNDYLPKPINVSDLMETITRHLTAASEKPASH